MTAVQEHTRRLNDKLRRELGPTVGRLLEEPDVLEIMLNPDGRLWVERLGHEPEPIGTMNAAQAESLMATVASTLRSEMNRENPILECELPLDGSRFEALIPPVVAAPTFTIRRKASKVFTLDDYVADGIISRPQREVIGAAVEQRKNILVIGGTGTGKTTLLNGIIDEIVRRTPQHRLVIIEDTGEVQCAADNAVILRATEHVDQQRLLKATLRLRPDRVLFGEVRGGEALQLLKAWNTGHPGGVATIHADNAMTGLLRLEECIAEVPESPMHRLIPRAVNIVVSIAKIDAPPRRRVDEILAVSGFDGGAYTTIPIQ